MDCDKDAEFIAHAREDVPALIQAVRERDAVIEELILVAKDLMSPTNWTQDIAARDRFKRALAHLEAKKKEWEK